VSRGLHLAILLLVAGTLLFWDLGALGLTDRDEGSNAEAAREMLESGDWITPTLNGEPRFAKPVFLYWLIGASYRIFGVSEWSARLPSAVFGMLLILLQYGFLSRVRGPMAALLGALMLLLNLEIVSIGRLVLTDSVLIFFTTLALYGFWLGLASSRRFMWLFYIGMALGTLTKGPVGFLIPVLAVVPYLTITRRWRRYWHEGFPLAGTLVFIVLAAPWYGLMLWIHGSHYTTSARADTVGRFFTVIGGHDGTVLFYIPVLLIGFFPWSGLLPAALWQTFQEVRRSKFEVKSSNLEPRTSNLELDLFAALWLIAGFIFFSASATRLPHYIAPLFPAAALLTASLWNRGLVDPAARGLRGAIRLMMVLGYLLGIALAAAPELYRLFIDKIAKEFPIATQVDPGTGPVMAGIILLLGMATVGYFGLSEKRRPGAFWAAAAVIIACLFVGLKSALPRLHHFFIDPPHQLAYVAGVNLNPEDRLILYGPPKPSYIFYARRMVVMVKPGEELKMVPLLTQPGRTMILLPSRLRGSLPSETVAYSVILERYGYILLASRPVIQVPEPPPEIKRRQFLSPHG
jgi:4-amino-4-deoxy-L-arabinose transferase-like glycosyltransferase